MSIHCYTQNEDGEDSKEKTEDNMLLHTTERPAFLTIGCLPKEDCQQKDGRQNESRKTRRKQLIENTRWKTRRKATRRKVLGGKLVARTDINFRQISYDSPNFVIIPCYEVLNYHEVLHCKL